MLVLQNIEGDSYNPIIDNYLVVKVINRGAVIDYGTSFVWLFIFGFAKAF